MSIDFTPGVINTYNGDIYNCTTNTDNVKTPDTPSGLVITGKNNTPLMPHSLENGYTSEQFDLAQQRQQINACHTNTTYTNADYSKLRLNL